MAHAVATTEGVLLRPVGSIAAGTTSSVTASFTRDREVDDIPRQLAELRPVLLEREDALHDAVATLAESQQQQGALTAEIEAARERHAKSELELAELSGVFVALRARLDGSRARTAAAGRELADLAAARGVAAEQREQSIVAAAEATRDEQAARQDVVALESRRAALTEAAGEQAATVAHLEGDLRTERRVGEGERIARERLGRQVATKHEQHARTVEEAQTVASRHAATRREYEAKATEIAALESDLAPAREELAQLESRERALTAELTEANAATRTAERALFDAENDVRARRDELETLRQNLEAEGFVAGADGEVQRAPVAVAEPEPGAPAEPQAPGDLPSWLRDDGDDDGGLPPVRGGAAINPAEVRDRIADLRAQIRALGPVNEQAAQDYAESRERYDFLTAQLTDLRQAEEQLREAIRELEGVIRERFRTTFRTVNREFERYFNAFFHGGTARLELGETDEDGLPGIEIIAQPPGKKLGSLALLSGGERSLTAVALLFALLQANPSPICVLDEVDAALDEANVGRFVDELRELSKRTQFVIITHNRRTIETADSIYGVSMGADSVSRVLSLRLADVQVAED